METFEMNGIVWSVIDVEPNSTLLIDRLGTMTLAVTDPYVHAIFMSRNLHGKLRQKVLIHEMCHCALVSYGLLDDIHRAVKPSDWIMAEEWVCNLFADYGLVIFDTVRQLLSHMSY